MIALVAVAHRSMMIVRPARRSGCVALNWHSMKVVLLILQLKIILATN
jgi:hypothetical protein